MACLNARTAKTGAGVSGASMKGSQCGTAKEYTYQNCLCMVSRSGEQNSLGDSSEPLAPVIQDNILSFKECRMLRPYTLFLPSHTSFGSRVDECKHGTGAKLRINIGPRSFPVPVPVPPFVESQGNNNYLDRYSVVITSISCCFPSTSRNCLKNHVVENVHQGLGKRGLGARFFQVLSFHSQEVRIRHGHDTHHLKGWVPNRHG